MFSLNFFLTAGFTASAADGKIGFCAGTYSVLVHKDFIEAE
jgi:hypothetical protein